MRDLCCQCVWQCMSFALKFASRVFERAGVGARRQNMQQEIPVFLSL